MKIPTKRMPEQRVWIRIAAALLCAGSAAAPGSTGAPPVTDYCAMLSQEIQGRKHAFLRGNLVNYVGGQYAVWNWQEDETLGLTHPFLNDLRSRGFGIVSNDVTGTGHDLDGWEFYRDTRVAYGTVLVGDTEYRHPVPKSMVWRPDRVICEYEVGGIAIREEKFVAANDVICTLIKSASPVRIRFEGRSYASRNNSVKRTAVLRYDSTNNVVHVVEGGTARSRPVEGRHVEGPLMYDGMSTVVSASEDFAETYHGERGKDDRQHYQFTVPCDEGGLAVCWAMHDDYDDARDRVLAVLKDPADHMAAKTASMNELLNRQIPYFRCSDPDIVNIYYYLWALYLMYYIDVGEGWEQYPHTQTAVNNFLGMHRFDANFQIPVGAWVKDKARFAYGNVLIWSALLPHAKSGGRLPDNMGQTWFSPYWETAIEHVVGAWDIYEHTGDTHFLHACYEPYFKPLFWNGTYDIWGARYDGAECLKKMARATGNDADVRNWHRVMKLNGREAWLKAQWQKDGVADYFGGLQKAIYPKGTRGKALPWTGMAYMRNSYFPKDWARRMTAVWGADTVKGFNGPVPMTLVAMQDIEHVFPDFASAPDLSYLSLIGMYRHDVGTNANVCTLGHFKKYHLKWGIPVAPESFDSGWEIWGDQYSNFNAGKILLILEGIAGLDYSIPGDTFTIRDTMPEDWSYMETMVPVTVNARTSWVRTRIERDDRPDGTVEKRITVRGNPLGTLRVQPWMEEKSMAEATQGHENDLPGRVGYTFTGKAEAAVSIRLRP